MLKLFKNFKKRDILYIIISILLIMGQVYLELKIPDYMAEITRLVQSEGSSINDVITQGTYMMICALLSLILSIFTGYFISNTAASFSYNTRKKLYTKVENLAVSDIKNFSTSSLITRTTNDITQIQMFIAMGMQILLKSVITASWAITKILGKSYEWSIITGIGVLILLATLMILTIMVVPKFKIVQKLTDRLNAVTRENLTGIRVVRAFNAEKFQENKFDKVNNDLTNVHLFTQKGFATLQPIIYLVMYFLTLAIYFVGADLIDNAMMQDKLEIFSNMVVFSSYAMQVIISFLMLAFVMVMLPRASVSASRINEVLSVVDKIKDGNKKVNKDNISIEFKNVSFKYEDAKDYLIKDVSFKVNKGQTLAVIGTTGSGKSTLVNLIPRFYDATEGSILINDIDIKEYKLEELYNILGYVSQRPSIFDGTIKSNITFGDNGKREINDEKLNEVAEISQVNEFALKFDDKLKSHVSSSGTNISGGQKQRISIARAIARDASIYIFDDSFSALDYKTDLKVRKELKKYSKDSIMIIVAQRIGTIINADKILVLDDGKLVGLGSHKELLKSCEVYKTIAESQLSKEELENA